MCTVLVLLAVYTVLNIFSNLVFYIAKLIVLLNKFYCPSNSRVSVERVIIVIPYNAVLELV